ncbi:toll-like receptor 2 [Anneissia japonica]|uniref:toll-like receptor 2 n=1 Tax=Anneissia japonica TaxID=1529436 RepID=UPI00142565FB|nr:toll-like receptor 2 [Anneissia japonica]
MKYYLLVCLVIPVSLAFTFQICYNHNPLRINGTQNASELRCPMKCKCSYCLLNKEDYLAYTRIVDCSYEHLSAVPPVETVPTDTMKYLLNKNEINSLKNNSFRTLTTLKYLNMESNDLSYRTIESDAFRGLKKLKYLSLSKNTNLHRLLDQWFVDLTSLEFLNLTHCGIYRIENYVFKHCKYLQTIDLSWNGIKSLPIPVFQNLLSLNYLCIDHNKLTSIPNKAFVGSRKLMNISVTDNSLTGISENVGLQNLISLHNLSVSFNKFSCDCYLVWFRQWIDKANVTFPDIDQALCYEPKSLYNSKFMDFEPDKLQCNTFITILKIAIPSASAGIAIAIIGFLMYYFRYDLRCWNERRRLRKQYQQLANQGHSPINDENIQYDAFVSYSNRDQEWILNVLQPSLETQRNFKLCVDYRDFIPGEAVVDNIANAVKYSRKVLLVVSKNFVKSEWCYFELEMARTRMFETREDVLVVVLLEKVSAKDMPVLLHTILTKKTYIEWEERQERQALFWAKLEALLMSSNCHRNRLLDTPPD